MIVRENGDHFIMIEQDDHAHISGEFIKNWHSDFFDGEEFRKSVIYAIYQHDIGWKAFDKQPFWNDAKQAPYTFIDYPTPAKTVLYTHGIDLVEQQDTYAALLCSEHYRRFLLHDDSNEAQAFVKQERARQQQIIASLPKFDQQLFDFHYGLLQLCDNVSLYLCLNEPDVTTENTHPFFRAGIPISPALHLFTNTKVQLSWEDENTVMIHDFPFIIHTVVQLQQRTLAMETIRAKGLMKAYESAPPQVVDIHLRTEKSP